MFKQFGALAAFALVGCDSRSDSHVREIAAAEAAHAVARTESNAIDKMAELERKNRQLEADLNQLRGLAISTSDALESLRKTFNGNVNIENRAKVARLTASGACGTERVNYPDGSWSMRNRECTLKDLR